MLVAYSGITSAAVLVISASNQTWQVVVMLGVIAVSSSGLVPAFLKQVGRHFPSDKRGLALGFFQMRIYLGTALASLVIFPSIYLG